jgi:hypothetical protein
MRFQISKFIREMSADAAASTTWRALQWPAPALEVAAVLAGLGTSPVLAQYVYGRCR